MHGMGAAANIQRRATRAGDVVAVRGELDLTNTRELGDALAAETARTVILDLSELAFLDSAAIRTIDGARTRFEQDGRRLLIVAPPASRAGWTFKVAGLTDETVLESMDVAEALASSGGDSS